MGLKLTDDILDEKLNSIKFIDSVNTWNKQINYDNNTNDGINKPSIIEQPLLESIPKIISQCAYQHAICSNLPPMYTYMLMAGAMNCATRGYFKVFNGQYEIPANTFIVQTADSGLGKSPTTKLFKSPIISFQNDYNDSIKSDLEIEEYEKNRIELRIRAIMKKDAKNTNQHKHEKYINQIKELKREAAQFRLRKLEIFADDITMPALFELMYMQNERIATMNAELGIIRSLTNAKSSSNYCEKFLRMFNRDSIKFDRRGETIILENPIIAIYIATQAESLVGILSNPYIIESGGSSRILVTITDNRNIGFRNFDNNHSFTNTENEYNSIIHKILHRIQSSNMRNETLTFDYHAQQEFIAIKHDIEKELRPGTELSSISEWARKFGNHISTIAAIQHLYAFPTENNIIAHNTLKTAKTVTYWLAQNMISFNNYAFPNRSKNLPFIIAKKIYDNNATSFTPRDIQRLFNNININEIQHRISSLLDYNVIYQSTRQSIQKQGRPAGQLYITDRTNLRALLDRLYYS